MLERRPLRGDRADWRGVSDRASADVTGDDIRAAIERARTTPELLEDARAHHSAIAAAVLSRNHDRVPGQLRISDAGSCQRELWAKNLGLLDIPEDAKSSLRMDNGSLFGAWVACLLKAGIEADAERDWRVLAEVETSHDGIPGHVDAVILESVLGALATVECKWTASPKVYRDPQPSHRVQSGAYALGERAPQHFVVVYFACSWAKDDFLVVHSFDTDETAFDVAIEYGRLRGALAETMPDPDPPEAYLCKSCRFSKCERNANPNRPAPDVAAALERSLAV